MTTMEHEHPMEPARPRERGLAVGGAAFEALAAVTGAVLAVLGLADIRPEYTVPIAVLAVGAALLFASLTEGGLFLRREQRRELAHREGAQLSLGLLIGAAGVILAVLALLNIAPVTLLAIAVILFGLALLAGTVLEQARVGEPVLLASLGGAGVVIGFGITVLGVLALIRIESGVLILVSVLTLSIVLLLASMARGGERLIPALHQPHA